MARNSTKAGSKRNKKNERYYPHKCGKCGREFWDRWVLAYTCPQCVAEYREKKGDKE